MASSQSPRYGKKDYWNTRYGCEELSGSSREDWILEYANLKKFLPTFERINFIVDVGCGISSFLFDMKNDTDMPSCENGLRRFLGIDFSNSAIEKSKLKYPGIEYVCSDAGDIFQVIGRENTVDLLIDKTSIDSQLCAGKSGHENVVKYCEGIGRVLKKDGFFIWITFQPVETHSMRILNNAILPGLLSSKKFHGLSWSVDIYTYEEENEEQQAGDYQLRPSIFVFSKARRSPRFLGDNVDAPQVTTRYI